MKKKLTLPDYITLLRMAGSVCLPFLEPFGGAFYTVYTLCGISDVLDGTIARATKRTTDLGARMDSAADLMFYGITLCCILPVLVELLPGWIWYAVAGVILIRLVSYGTAALKYHRFASQHTYLNKLTGFSLFLVAYLIRGSYIVPYSIGVCAMAGLSSAEELLIHLTQKEYRPERKSLLGTFFQKA